MLVPLRLLVHLTQSSCLLSSFLQGQDYLSAMAAAANYAWVNRGVLTFLAREAFSKVFKMSPDDLDMQVVYDVSHNIAKFEVVYCVTSPAFQTDR